MERKAEDIKKMVKVGYAKVARQNTSCCPAGSCCSPSTSARDISTIVGYSEKEMSAVPEGANLGLGCGNPVALASLKKGDIVLDLGSGAGFDAFLTAQRVGKEGRVIGVDMTPEMVKKARANAKKGNFTNVEFRLGEIEKLPVEDNSVDVVISNCVINLSPEKQRVFQEAFRVLKPGGRLMVSDLVLIKELPKSIKESVEAYVGCLAGAIKKNEYLKFMTMAGFQDVKVISQSNYPVDAMTNDITAQMVKNNQQISPKDIKDTGNAVASIKVSAKKPAAKGAYR